MDTATKQLPLDEQVALVLQCLQGKKLDRESKFFRASIDWLSYLNGQQLYEPRRRELLAQICETFNITEAEVYATASGLPLVQRSQLWKSSDPELRALLPRGGWFEWYDEYTMQTESPLSFHTFSSFCVLGAALGRRVYFDMGFFQIFPNFRIVLIGPTGRVMKTSAADIARGLVDRAVLCPIMADAITPEALATALMENGGHQFIYAGELSVLFNRQKYNEALVTRIIRLLDCPTRFAVRTEARGEEVVENIALTILGASTMSLLAKSTPELVTSSGFLNRFMSIVEEDTEREFHVPRKGVQVEHKIITQLERLKHFEGAAEPTVRADRFHQDWHHERKKLVRALPDETTAELMQRGQEHFLRMAMVIHLVQHDDLVVCEECMQVASRLLTFAEKNILQTSGALKQTVAESETDRIMSIVRRLGGAADHSTLLRRSRLDAVTFRRHMDTLLESKTLRGEKRGAMQFYIIEQEKE